MMNIISRLRVRNSLRQFFQGPWLVEIGLDRRLEFSEPRGPLHDMATVINEPSRDLSFAKSFRSLAVGGLSIGIIGRIQGV